MESLRFSDIRVRFVSAIVLFIAAVIFCVPSAYAQSTPEQTLTAFYKWYVHELVAEHHPRPTSPKVNAVISNRLRRWFKTKEGRERDADYFTDAQDFDPKWETHIKTSKAVINGNNADLRITLGPVVKAVNAMSPHTLRVKMVKEGGSWKIDHINGY